MNKLFKFISFALWAVILFKVLPFFIGLLIVVALIIANRVDKCVLIGSTIFIQTKLPHLWGAQATTIAPFLVLTDSLDMTDALVLNEQCHAEHQYPELLWFGFYLVYLRFSKRPYELHPLERESNLAQKKGYLENRKPFAWRKLI